ncbi:transport and golgi organization 9 [Rhodnius prolixus]|uniref:Putative permeases of the drug/metabolite transporter dmt superfamily n=2 Tax=Rhodnius TaxID=13248 RepID=R4G451_RHOPR
MAWTAFQTVIAVVMVFTGSINTLTTKWADHLKAKGTDGKTREFDHPFVQALCMFFGEFLCLVVFKVLYFAHKRKQDSAEENGLIKGRQDFNAFILLPPALCDMIGTSLMYIGLNLTNPSSFQMLRGSVIVFVALLSMIFLRRKITWQQWLGILLVLAGLVVVGVSDYLLNKDSAESSNTNNMIMGDLIIVGAQIITAAQMVYEEKYITVKEIPALQAVGWEGTFGFIVLGLLQIPFYYIVVPPPFSSNSHSSLEDFPDAMYQSWDNKLIILALIGTIISIAFFNFAGITVTKELSATTRMILDSVRTLFIWGFSLIVSWQKFHPLQILGFLLLIMGMCIYNNLLPTNRVVAVFRRNRDEELITAEDPS